MPQSLPGAGRGLLLAPSAPQEGKARQEVPSLKPVSLFSRAGVCRVAHLQTGADLNNCAPFLASGGPWQEIRQRKAGEEAGIYLLPSSLQGHPGVAVTLTSSSTSNLLDQGPTRLYFLPYISFGTLLIIVKKKKELKCSKLEAGHVNYGKGAQEYYMIFKQRFSESFTVSRLRRHNSFHVTVIS